MPPLRHPRPRARALTAKVQLVAEGAGFSHTLVRQLHPRDRAGV